MARSVLANVKVNIIVTCINMHVQKIPGTPLKKDTSNCPLFVNNNKIYIKQFASALRPNCWKEKY